MHSCSYIGSCFFFLGGEVFLLNTLWLSVTWVSFHTNLRDSMELMMLHPDASLGLDGWMVDLPLPEN